MLELQSFITAGIPKEDPIENVEDIPKEFDLFFKDETEFLPDGKTWADLTPEEYERIRCQYRFSPYKPGVYQSMTGIQHTMM